MPGNEVVPLSVIKAQTSAEIDTQIATAKRYPRNELQARERCIAMATIDEATAASCIYVLPRAGKTVEGGSVRLAEIVASCWGHLRVASRVVDDKDSHNVTVQAVCHDLEANLQVQVEKRRRITTKDGRRFNDDMITTTVNAATSIAFRDAVFRVVPRACWAPVLHAARQVVAGEASTLSERRTKAVEAFTKIGVFPDRLLPAIGCTMIEDITADQLVSLRAILQQIRDGEMTVDEAFPDPISAAGSSSVVEKARSAVAAAKGDA